MEERGTKKNKDTWSTLVEMKALEWKGRRARLGNKRSFIKKQMAQTDEKCIYSCFI